MTAQQIRAAIDRATPFTIMMADGKSYRVPQPDYISIQPKGTFVVVFDDNDGAFVLPLLTMTGIAYDVQPTARIAEEN